MKINAGVMRPKYRVPRLRHGAVERPKLFRALDEASTSPVTVINAAAGSGKTSLVAGWLLCHSKRASAWVRLDAEDRDPIRLVRNLWASVASSAGAAPDFAPATRALLESPNAGSVAALIETFAIEMAALKEPLAMVLDDYNQADGPAARQIIEHMVDNCGHNVAMILLTRSEPDLPIAVWHARSQVVVLSQGDIAFSSDEALHFFKSTMGLDLDDASVDSLHARTEGWIAGLQLAALSLQAEPASVSIDDAARSLTARHHLIKDYFSEGFVERLDRDTVRFLEDTSVLDSMSASICNALTGRSDAGAVLRELERLNLFIVPLDGERDWYRYHDLFRTYLLDRLDPDEASRLHRLASQWFASRSQFEDAFKHAIASRDAGLIVSLIRTHAEDIVGSTLSGDLLEWTSALSPVEQRQHPDILGLQAWILYLRGTERDAEPLARMALSSQHDASMQTGLMLAFRAYCALRWDGPGDTATLCTTALERLAPRSLRLRSLMLSYRGQALAEAGRSDEAIASYLEALQPRASRREFISISGTLLHLVDLLLECGRSAEARGIAQDYLDQVADARSAHQPHHGPAFVAMAQIHFSSNELIAAKQAAETGLALIDKGRLVFYRLAARVTLARVLHALAEPVEAWRVLEEADVLSQRAGGQGRHNMVQSTVAELHVQDGNFARAAHAVSQLSGDSAALLQCRLLMARKCHSEAIDLSNNVLARSRTSGHVRSAIMASVVLALACAGQGDRSSAQAHLQQSLVLAAAGRYLRPFLDAGTTLLPLLAASASAAPGFVDEIVAAFTKGAAGRGPSSRGGLTPKDREVLTLMSRGMQNKEIANALIITLGTTKQYVNRLYVKLGARNRVEAISEARRLHVIP